MTGSVRRPLTPSGWGVELFLEYNTEDFGDDSGDRRV
jgi:hypothetical protein